MDDPFDLMDRLEYWVVQKDIAKDAGLLDQVCFSISNEDAVTMTTNGCLDSAKTLMHVDTSVPLWAFFDLIGSTCAIQMVGTESDVVTVTMPNRPSHPPPLPPPQRNVAKEGTSPGNSGDQNEVSTDCVICYDKPMDTVFYTCGHLCRCSACASTYDKGKGCAICRQPIVNVIHLFKA